MFRDSRLSEEETNTFWIQDIFISHPHQRTRPDRQATVKVEDERPK